MDEIRYSPVCNNFILRELDYSFCGQCTVYEWRNARLIWFTGKNYKNISGLTLEDIQNETLCIERIKI
jgi:hypothetical protein